MWNYCLYYWYRSWETGNYHLLISVGKNTSCIPSFFKHGDTRGAIRPAVYTTSFLCTSCMFMCVILLQFSYSGSEGIPVHVVQLTFLQLLSATAKQTFTYHCLNSAAWLHSATHSHEHALRFRGTNGEELTHENTHYISALYDGCQVSNTEIHLTVNTHHLFFIWLFHCVSLLQTRSGQERTVLEFDTPMSSTLPILDVAVPDFGKGNQKFGFQVGPVCYNG